MILEREYNAAVEEQEEWDKNLKLLSYDHNKMELVYQLQLQEAQEENKWLRQANQIATTNMAIA